MIAGTFSTSRGGSYAYLVLAGTAHPDHALGTLDGGALAPLAQIAIEAALQMDSTTIASVEPGVAPLHAPRTMGRSSIAKSVAITPTD